ncbi:MAG: hypothetical protein KUG77_16085 [Nannocystaceae bacterium]|nr:hypothetical protein [Nannocystaceae bacterium]
MSMKMFGLQRSTTRARTRLPRPSRRPAEEELQLLAQELTLEFRGKHVLRARGLSDLAEECLAIPGLADASERLLDFFDDTDNGNWVDGSGLFRLGRADHLNRLKRHWREFETRRSTLRQYLRSTTRAKLPDGCVQFKIPQERLESPKAFISAYRHLVGGLDRLCRLVLSEGFRIDGFSDRSAILVIEAETAAVFTLASQLLSHYDWYEEQSTEVRSLEARASISDEYAKAAKSLAAAQLRHLRVLVETTVRESMTNHDAERFEKATTLAGEYIGLLGAYVKEGAKVTLPRPAPATDAQAA